MHNTRDKMIGNRELVEDIRKMTVSRNLVEDEKEKRQEAYD